MPSSDHQRETTTPIDLLTDAEREQYPAGATHLVDCSCGESYTLTVLPGHDEYEELERAQELHAAGNVSGLVHYVHDSERTGAADKQR
jgi:hypothetical protein